ncbi:MAG: transketolase [Acidobacteria bacterium]|nr:transketolase [Chloroflexota bacterium]MYN67111.1 transketolase [Acidobacteriota bacterium]
MASVRATSAAGSGHPSSCCSAADIVAALFFGHMRFDPRNPQDDDNDRFVLSKGHAAPLLYAAWAEAGFVPPDDLLKLRRIDSDLEGHPTPRLPFVDVATGSLGQGICAAVGIALNARRIGSDYRTYVLIGDGESAEGSVWEAAQVADRYRLDNLCGIIDVNGFGQSRATQWGHDMAAYRERWKAFGWHAVVVDGHDVGAIVAALEEARGTTGRPTMILARTVKGKGVSLIEGKDGWHGKPIEPGAHLDAALDELNGRLGPETALPAIPLPPARSGAAPAQSPAGPARLPSPPAYEPGSQVATRTAYGDALAALGAVDSRIVALDADVGNSTFSQTFENVHPDRFVETYIAEQAMVGAAMGLASRGAIPFPSTFAAFLTRASDFVRMAGIGGMNIKLAGSHAGISIGEDGPSQMALEDLAMMRAVPGCAVLYPCDAVSAARLVEAAAGRDGMVYIRTSRPKTPVIYGPDDEFPIGGSKALRESPDDAATVVAAGVTLFEALRAHDALAAEGIALRVIDAYSVQPVDRRALVDAARRTGDRLITVEDHYAAGGLGDAVSEAVAPDGIVVERLAVREVPRSGRPGELLERFGISASCIAAAVRRQVGNRAGTAAAGRA